MSYIDYFSKNLYVLFTVIIFSLFVGDYVKSDKNKIIVIYIFISLLAVFKILSILSMLLIFLILFFLYFEILIDDYYKNVIIRKIRYKIIDFLYLLIFKYHFILFFLGLFFVSSRADFIFEIFKFDTLYIRDTLFMLWVFFIVCKISGNIFELCSFTKMYERMQEINFGNFKKLDDEKTDILLFLEDRSYYLRKNSYTVLSFDYYKYQMTNLKNILRRLPKKIKSLFRGFSTIEVQLFRSIGINTGYEKTFIRKTTEFIYTPIFFKGLKELYKQNYSTVSDEKYKDYLIKCYLNWALVRFNEKKYKNIYSLFENYKGTISNSDFLFYCLCLSKNSERITLDKEEFYKNFGYLVDKFNISDNQLTKTLGKMEMIANKN